MEEKFLALLIGNYIATKNTRELNWIKLIIGTLLVVMVLSPIINSIAYLVCIRKHTSFSWGLLFGLKGYLKVSFIGLLIMGLLKLAKNALIKEFPDVVN